MKAEETTQEQHTELIANYQEFMAKRSAKIAVHELYFEYLVWSRKKEVRHLSEKAFEKVREVGR